MVSYAQNGEDVVLRRAFADSDNGFYVDVGACVPVIDSVTLHFYNQGWSGVNVEPDPEYFAEFVEARERDVNLNVAIGGGNHAVTFYPTDIRGRGTLDPRAAAQQSARPPLQVEQLPLSRVLALYAPKRGVDFLKVDVEGWEAEVLASADWSDVRPRVVVVEAVDLEGRPTHEEWEGPLLAAGYRFALFDGLNRFYCRDEEAEQLLPRLAVPANPIDNWRRAREVQLETDVEAIRAALETVKQAHAETRAAFDAEQLAHAKTAASLRATLDAELEAHAKTRAAFDAEQLAHVETAASLRATLDAELEAHAKTRAVVELVMTSTSWRVSAPLRSFGRRVKELAPRPRAMSLRRHAVAVDRADGATTISSDPAAVLEVAGIPAEEILRRSAALRAARETARRN
jgi:FkbM family methyltransferase